MLSFTVSWRLSKEILTNYDFKNIWVRFYEKFLFKQILPSIKIKTNNKNNKNHFIPNSIRLIHDQSDSGDSIIFESIINVNPIKYQLSIRLLALVQPILFTRSKYKIVFHPFDFNHSFTWNQILNRYWFLTERFLVKNQNSITWWNHCKNSKTFVATPRRVVNFRLGSEVFRESKDTFQSVSGTLGSILEVVGTIRSKRFHFWLFILYQK